MGMSKTHSICKRTVVVKTTSGNKAVRAGEKGTVNSVITPSPYPIYVRMSEGFLTCFSANELRYLNGKPVKL